MLNIVSKGFNLFFIPSVIGPLSDSFGFQQTGFLHGQQVAGDDGLRKPRLCLNITDANSGAETESLIKIRSFIKMVFRVFKAES